MRRALQRLLTGSVVALLAAAVVGAPGAPALAADPALRVQFLDLSVAGKNPKTGIVWARVKVPGTKPTVVRKLTVSVDTADVDDIATVADNGEHGEYGDDPCVTAGTVITCENNGEVHLDPGANLLSLAGLSVTAKPGAAEGANGKLKFTARIDDGPAATSQSTVTIGEGVDLEGFLGKVVTVEPGKSAGADLRVRNAGTRPVKGVVLVTGGWNRELLGGETYSNCTYGRGITCTFEDELATGTTYELSKPIRVKVPADAATGSQVGAWGIWYTPSDYQELLNIGIDFDDEVIGKKGTGGPVALRALPAGKGLRATNQVDTNRESNRLFVGFVVGGNLHTDLAAIGATVTGTEGDRVRTRVGYVNNGPGVLYQRYFGNVAPTTRVDVPAGLRAVEVDKRCSVSGTSPWDYTCYTSGDKVEAGTERLFDFTFEVRDNASTEAGQVKINGSFAAPIDRDASNDIAKITVELSGGSGGGLPVTGANAGLLGAAGGVLLLAGVLGLMLVRRRRVRFTV